MCVRVLFEFNGIDVKLTKDRKKGTNYRSADLCFRVAVHAPSPDDPLPLISAHWMFRSELLSAEPSHPIQANDGMQTTSRENDTHTKRREIEQQIG